MDNNLNFVEFRAPL